MNKVTSTLLILGALFMLEANTTAQAASITPDGHQIHQTNILLARLVHGGVYFTRPPAVDRDEERQNTETHNQDQQSMESHNNVHAEVNRDRTYDNGHGAVPSYEHGHWTDGTGTVHY